MRADDLRKDDSTYYGVLRANKLCVRWARGP